MKRRLKTQLATTAPAVPEEQLYVQVRHVLAHARGLAHRSVNQAMVQAYWQVGRLIVEHEQAGQARAAYGARQLEALGQRLTQEFGRGFSAANLRNFRQFFQTYGWTEICDMPCRELSWSHLRRLMRVADPQARAWYAAEAGSQTWSFAALDRQISTQCFVLVELKVGKLSHQDVGQLDMYVRVFDERERQPGDNPTIGLILCSERNAAVARYSRLADGDQLFASRYQAYLPTEAELQAELARERALLGDERSRDR
ncbi:MAG: DUF1016 family protein [Aquincola sp.]|nr:DUF1016 family protein [Aquincola sp.]